MTTVIIAAVIVALALAVAAIATNRKPDVPTAPSHAVPEQVDRADFDHADAAWLLVVFSSATCDSCAEVVAKAQRAQRIATADVMVHEVEVGANKSTHDRYNIDAVPILLLVDSTGVVRVSFLGPIPQEGLQHSMADLGLAPKPDDGGTSVQLR